jgi:hypothetical protein
MHVGIFILAAWAQSGSVDQTVIDRIARSGRVVEAEPIAQRLANPLRDIAPGAPPLLAFRYFDGADKHRFGKLDLVVDDAGH